MGRKKSNQTNKSYACSKVISILITGNTVHSRYLGSKKPFGGLYHYINIGSFFLMLLDKYGINKLLHVMYFSINMSGVEDNVENYQTYLISCSTVIVFESYGILFFVLSLISRSLS